jgi:hypothetical protein
MIFLVGARRSGTNWLQRILTAHPDVVGLPSETYLFSHGIEPLTALFQHANPGSPMMGRMFVERERFLDAVRNLTDQAFLDNLERLGGDARYLIERTPMHASHLDLIASVYPDARVIHIVRDGRAVARSLVSLGFADDIEAAAEEWRASVEGGRRGASLFAERYREVVYERLIDGLDGEVGALFDWLDLPASAEVHDRILREAASEFNVDPSSPGVRAEKWRDELSATDLLTIQRIAGAQLRECGYERAAADDGARPAPERRRRLRRPRRARAPSSAALGRRMLHANHAVVERFEREVSDGALDAALAELAADVQVRIVAGASAHEGRGPDAARKLLDALEQHRVAGLRPTSGHLHASALAFTSVITYELADGSTWARTLVMGTADEKLTAVSMYRYRVAGG